MSTYEVESSTGSRHPYSHPHVCLECHKEFVGRRNRIYCSKACKVTANNLKAAERRYGVSEQVRTLEKNSQILKEIYQEKGGPVNVSSDQLLKLGFFENGPNIRLLDANQIEWCQIGFYIFNINSTNGVVTIMSKRDFENL
jgi:hypothetical protein